MTAREAFGVIVRTLGVCGFIMSAFDLFHIALGLTRYESLNKYPVTVDVFACAFYAANGIILIGGANFITRLAYGRPNSN
jgi:hypothetical protein